MSLDFFWMGRKAMKNRRERWKTWNLKDLLTGGVYKSEKESKMMVRFWAWGRGCTREP